MLLVPLFRCPQGADTKISSKHTTNNKQTYVVASMVDIFTGFWLKSREQA
jgi:hypothetical protein